ncbi:MAG TPA: cytochrome P450 [Pseudolabrys sp.]|nr:cytochrome P450 [Pseudolabrys sp.]
MLDALAEFRPPAPAPRSEALGPLALLRVLSDNPLEAWTIAHFHEPLVVSGFSLGRVAVVSDPAAIRRVLIDNCANYEKDWLQRRVLSAGLTGGLLTAEGDDWRRQRRTLAPLFARKTVMSFAKTVRQAANGLVDRLDQNKGEVVDMAVEVTRLTLDVLERTIFSDGLQRSTEDIRLAMKDYFETIGRLDPFDIFGVPEFVPRPRRWKLRPTRRLFDATIDAIIAARRDRLAKDPKSAPADLLTRLLEAADPETGAGLSEQQVRANILTFIAAGHETTANCIAWTLFLLSQSDLWCERVRAEAERVLDGASDDVADRLVETRAVIDEANRLYPPIAAISRTARSPDVLAGVPIEQGMMVVIAPYVLHRHRAIWTKPDVFDPNRFLGNAGSRSVDRFAYLPFGAGPRICIGAAFALQEASIVVSTLVRNFTMEIAPGYNAWPVQKVTLRLRGGLPMILRRR